MWDADELRAAMDRSPELISSYRDYPEEIKEAGRQAQRACWRLDMLDPLDDEARAAVCRGLFGTWDDAVVLRQGFRCDYGFNIHFHGFALVNYDVTILDTSRVDIGVGAMIAPGVRIVPASHAVDPVQRADGVGTSSPVRIGNNAWIGAGATVLGGVTVGAGSVIGAGSVVTHDISAGVVAMGVPCRVVRPIGPEDRLAP